MIITVAPINGLKLNIISMLTFLEICASNKQKKHKIKVIHHSNVGITGTIRKNLQRATISYKHIQLHMEKNSFFKFSLSKNVSVKFEIWLALLTKQVATICFIL
ncbi:hypothetical protein T07_9592 [Trichinella nelsoni]|uniref:Uncharacterized protein n=1 Tax=Trichinella nelsoni TaxID=6336 RepID=A0A0V0REP2_9BILA|nr:hypothetical protein T07_9592 [Trichinella nelsoni]